MARFKSIDIKRKISILSMFIFSLTHSGFASNPGIDLSVVFDINPVKVGIGASRTSETPAYPATAPASFPHRLTATITPATKAGEITFDSSKPARTTVAEVSRVEVGNTVKVILKVIGVTKTPAGSPDGDANIRALQGVNICASTKVVVIKPTSRTHAVAAATLQNTSKAIPNGTQLTSTTRPIVTITIKDQFGTVLNDVYNGKNVVEEIFENVTNGGLVTLWSPIIHPDMDLINGVKLDETGRQEQLDLMPALTPALEAQWAAGTFLPFGPNGGNNVFVFNNAKFTTEGDMKLRVDGHAVTPDIHRKIVSSATNHPPAPTTTTDTPK